MSPQIHLTSLFPVLQAVSDREGESDLWQSPGTLHEKAKEKMGMGGQEGTDIAKVQWRVNLAQSHEESWRHQGPRRPKRNTTQGACAIWNVEVSKFKKKVKLILITGFT